MTIKIISIMLRVAFLVSLVYLLVIFPIFANAISNTSSDLTKILQISSHFLLCGIGFYIWFSPYQNFSINRKLWLILHLIFSGWFVWDATTRRYANHGVGIFEKTIEENAFNISILELTLFVFWGTYIIIVTPILIFDLIKRISRWKKLSKPTKIRAKQYAIRFWHKVYVAVIKIPYWLFLLIGVILIGEQLWSGGKSPMEMIEQFFSPILLIISAYLFIFFFSIGDTAREVYILATSLLCDTFVFFLSDNSLMVATHNNSNGTIWFYLIIAVFFAKIALIFMAGYVRKTMLALKHSN